MKFMALLYIGAAAVSALQAPITHQLAPRDLTGLTGLTSLLQPVLNGLGQLTVTTNSYPACGLAGLETTVNVMTETLTTATQAVNYLKPLTMEEAQGFKDFAMKMSAAGNGFFTAIESKLPLFGQDHICGQLVGCITNLGAHVSQLMNTVESKFTTRAGISDIQHFGNAFKTLVAKLQACGGTSPAAASPPNPNPYLPPGTTPAPASAPAPAGVTPLSASASGPKPSSTTGGGGGTYRTNATATHPAVVATAGAELDDVPSWVALVVAVAALIV